MKLVAQLKLLASPAQAGLLRRTLATANAAANTISAYAHAHRTFRTCDLHRALYYTIKHDFGLVGAKWRPKRLAGRSGAFERHKIAVIDQRIVAKAEHTKRAIGVEDLTLAHPPAGQGWGTEQRARQSNWAFGQLRAFVTYKARRAGVPLVVSDAASTSQRCSACGHTERRNRRSQAVFCCVLCAHSLPADYNAALNIERAAVNQPMVARARPVAASHLL